MKAYSSTIEMVRTGRPGVRSPRGTLVEIRVRSVPWSSVAHLSAKLGIPVSELLPVIGIPERTALRRQKEGYLKPDEADRLLRVARVLEEASRVFGSEAKAARWLNEPSVMFSDAAPLLLLESDAGTQVVTEELIRIDFGDFA